MKKFREFVAEAAGSKEEKFKSFAKDAITQLTKDQSRAQENIKRFEKQWSRDAVSDVLDILPLNREKLADKAKKDGVSLFAGDQESKDFLVKLLSTKGGWKRFGPKTLDLG